MANTGHYQSNIDYESAIRRAKEAGAEQDVIDRLEQERRNKINAASDEQLTKWGITRDQGGDTYSVLGGYAKPVQQQKPTIDIMGYLNSYRDSLRNSRIAALDKARASSLSSLNAEQAGLAGKYNTNRQQAAAASDLGKNSFAKFLAKRGLRNSGAAAQGQIAANTALQGTMGSINSAETSANQDIAQRKSDIENAYQTDVANAGSEADVSILPQMISQMNADRAFESNQADEALQRQIDTLGAYSNDYDAEIRRRQGTADTSDDTLIPYLQQARQQKIANMQAAQATAEEKAAKAKSEAEQQAWDNAMDIWKQNGTVPNQAMADILGVPVGSKTADYNIDSINANANQTRANRTGANSPSRTDQTNADLAEDYAALKAMPVRDAVQAMNSSWSEMIAKYGLSAAKQLWNEVLADAIAIGQAVEK